MTARTAREEGGQSVVEMAIIMTIMLLLTGGLLDVGRAFYAYNAVSNAARYAARWGGVVGGTCSVGQEALGLSQNDFCDQLSPTQTQGNQFWAAYGDIPLQGWGTYCTAWTGSGDPHYYSAVWSGSGTQPAVTNFRSSTQTTIVGAAVQRFDSTSGATSVILGDATPGFDLTRLHVCIDSNTAYGSNPQQPLNGDWVGVTVTYQFKPIGPLFGSVTFNLSATSQFVVE